MGGERGGEPRWRREVPPTVSRNLVRLGLTLPEPPRPVAAYVPARIRGEYCWTSGQLPFRDGQLLWPGAVGGTVGVEQAREAARQAALNAVAAAAAVVGGVDHLGGVIKLVGYVHSAPGFFGQPEVVNGASELMLALFEENGRHARSAVGVAALPLNAPVEIEVVFWVQR
ncbi:MAG: RidA family protein [Actinomycetia bacterium]|nr:RidA family protein [Actinomycetes bacterium]